MAGFAPEPNFERTFIAPTPHSASQPTVQFFGDCNLRTAIDFAEAAEAELEAWSGMECSTFFGVAGFAPKPKLLADFRFLKIEKLLYLFMHSNFRQASFKRLSHNSKSQQKEARIGFYIGK